MKWKHNTPERYRFREVNGQLEWLEKLEEIEHDITGNYRRDIIVPVLGEKKMANPVTTPSSRNPVKPGVHTTEFWAMVLADVVAVLNADQVWTFLSPHNAAIVGAVVTAAYTLSRGWAKSGS